MEDQDSVRDLASFLVVMCAYCCSVSFFHFKHSFKKAGLALSSTGVGMQASVLNCVVLFCIAFLGNSKVTPVKVRVDWCYHLVLNLFHPELIREQSDAWDHPMPKKEKKGRGWGSTRRLFDQC